MATPTPDSAEQVAERLRVDVQRSAPDSNPFLSTHWLRSIIDSLALRIYDFYRDLTRTEDRLFPDTASSDALTRWGAIFGLSQNPATAASGNVVATGTAGSIIPVDTGLTAGGIVYKSTSSATISAQVVNVSSITRSGTTATVTTADDHNLSSFVPVTIAGATETEYNGTDLDITVTGSDTFTYEILGSPTTPATGTITAAFTAASVPIQSDDFGADTNQTQDAALTLQSAITGVDSTLYVDNGEVGGGTDVETDSDYRARYLERFRNPVAHFNISDIESLAKTISGVTRVFVQEANTETGTVTLDSLTRSNNVATGTVSAGHGLESGQTTTISGADQADYNVTDAKVLIESATVFHYVVSGTPTTPATGGITSLSKVALGQVFVYFMRDADDDPIPSASEVATVKALLDTIRPANTSTDDLVVSAPTANSVDYTFSELSPNTATMRAAITASLEQFHADSTQVGVDDDQKVYEAAITNTVDPDTGDTVESFTLSAPTGDIANGAGEISTLGTVTYP